MPLPRKNKVISIFISCLVDNFFPEVGEAMVKVLSKMGLEPKFPKNQTCCGQPAFNSGHRNETEKVASHFLDVFDDYDCPMVCPSGSCVSMVKHYYRELFRDNPEKLTRAEKISSRIYEFSEFVFDKKQNLRLESKYRGKVTFHDSCHALRELGISSKPRELIRSLDGVNLVEMDMSDACCGFGGTFSIKYPEVSKSMLEEKVNSIMNSGADAVVSTDMGCLMNIRGLVSRKKLSLEVLHLSELLAFEENK